MVGKKKKKKGKPEEDKKSATPERFTNQDGWEAESLLSEEQQELESLSIEESLSRQLENARTQIQRMTAEFDNFRKRTREERGKTLMYANEALVGKLIPVLDDFARAIEHMDESGEAETSDVFDGVRLIRKRLVKTLEESGVATFQTVGERFDPSIHEAVRIEDQVGVPGEIIVSEFEVGYKFHDRLLRAAKVVVTPLNKPAPLAEQDDEKELVDEAEAAAPEDEIAQPQDAEEAPVEQSGESAESDAADEPPEIPEEALQEEAEADLVEAEDLDAHDKDDIDDFLELTPEFRELSDEEKAAVIGEDVKEIPGDTLPDATTGEVIQDDDWEMDVKALEDPEA